MRKQKTDYFLEILDVLKELKIMYPSSDLSSHLSVVFSEYRDIWGVTDKELLYALKKYKAQMTMDVPHSTDDKELEKIINDGVNLKGLSSILDEDEDY